MGRHEAADGAERHPLVEEALHRRPQDAAHGVHEAASLPGREGPIGWPGAEPDPGDAPIGWPEAPPDAEAVEQSAAEPQRRDGAVRSGWRRLLGGPSAA